MLLELIFPGGDVTRTKRKVLFLCTGNSCRSQMAKGLQRHFGGADFTAYSAGLAPEQKVHPLAVKVMEEIGIDISRQEPKGVGTYLGRESINIIITVCNKPEESCPRLWHGVKESNRLYWPLEDPQNALGDLDERAKVFRKTRDNLVKRTKEI